MYCYWIVCFVFFFPQNLDVKMKNLGSFGAVADPGADPAHAPPTPPASRFFHFDTQILWDVAVSGVGAPLLGNPESVTA